MDTLGEWSDGDDEWIFDVDVPDEWDDPEADAFIRNIPEQMLLDAWNNYVTDGSIRDIPEQMMPTEWDDPEADAFIRDIPEQTDEWNDPEADAFIQNIPEQTDERNDPEADAFIQNIPEQTDERNDPEQTGEGKKRKHDDGDDDEGEQDFYEITSVKKYTSKKFRATATDTEIRFNNVINDMDLIENHRRTHRIFERLLSDVTKDMDERDQVRFVLRSTQLDTPISIPFLPLGRLTPERVLSAVEHVIQSNRDFRLNDTVNVDLIHVEAPQGSGRSKLKRNIVNIKEYLHKKGSVITIKNQDNLCLARALVVAIAKVDNAPNYNNLLHHVRAQQVKAIELHANAKVPMGPSCGLEEVDMFQKHLTTYEINIVSGNHDNAIIYPKKPSTDKTPIYLFLHDNH